MSKPKPWELDPTYLEQTGLDPQQVWQRVQAEMRQATPVQTTSPPPTSSSPPPPTTTSAGGRQSVPQTAGSSSSSPSPPTTTSTNGQRSAPPASSSPPPPRTRAAEHASRLDPTALEQSGLDPQQVWRQIEAEMRRTTSQTQGTSPPTRSPSSGSSTPRSGSATSSASGSSSGHRPPDYVLYQQQPPPQATGRTSGTQTSTQRPKPWRLDPTYLERTGLDPQQVRKELEAAVRQTLASLAQSASPSAGSVRPPDYLLQPPSATARPPSFSRPAGNIGAVPADYLLDQRNPVNVVNRLSAALDHLKRELEQTVSRYGDVLQYSGSAVDMSRELKEKLDRYNKALEELKKSLPDVEKELRRRFGNYVVVSGGTADLAPSVKALIDRASEFASLYGNITREYKAALDDLVRRYGLERDEEGRLIAPPDKYDKVKAELEALSKKYAEELEKLYGRYRDVVNRKAVDGDVLYEFKPEVKAAFALRSQLEETVRELSAAQQQALQNVLGRYGDVLTYDPKTGRIAPSKELEEMWNRYTQAVQEVGRIADAMSAVAGMIPAFAKQLPVLTVKFQAYDRASNRFVEVGGETPIYVRDEKMREEIVSWMRQNEGRVRAAAFYDPNKPVVYVYNDRDEGYIIFPATGEARRARGVSGMVEDTAKAMWLRSLTDEELKKWLEAQRRKGEVELMPPGLRELYAALMGAGQFAVVSPALDVLARWLRGEDPTKGLEKFKVETAAAAQASPLAYHVGQAVGAIGVAGLAAEALIARGAALGAQGVGRQFVAGLKASAKPAAAGAAAGAAFGAVEGALTGRDPLAEAVKFGAVGLLTGLGGVAREQLIAGGILGAVVGASTAKEHGVEKGLEAGSAVFLLPIVAPEKLARGVFTGLAAERRPTAAAGLKAESVPAVETKYAQAVRGLAAQVRSKMETKPEPGLTPEDAALIAARLRAKPAEQRAFFQSLVEDAVAKIRGGADAEAVLAQLKLIRDKLDSASKMRLDEVLRQYGLAEVKHRAPEYSLRGEDAPALARLFRREPQYQLTDEAAKLLDQLFKTRREPEYALRDEVAPALDRLFKRDMQRTPEYQLTDDAATLLNRFLKMEQEPAFRPAAVEQQPAVRSRVEYTPRQEPWFALKTKTLLDVSTGKKLASQVKLEPVLTRKPELEVSAKLRPRQEPKPAFTARTEIQLPTRRELGAEVGRPLSLPEVQKSALVRALEVRTRETPTAPPKIILMPEIKQSLEWAQGVGRKLVEIGELLKSPHGVLQLLRKETPKEEERRPFVAKPPMLQTETPPQYAKPPTYTPELFGDILKYNPPLLTRTTTPTTVDVPPPPTYTPATVPKISEVPTVDIPTVPTYETTPMPRPEPLPRGWWRLLPPHIFMHGRDEGAYKVQFGKRQVLLLA